ncbi:MAG: NAD-dependent epimerase/dehydratase family protein [Pantoea sp. Pent]|nr:NAD-dependent epimerase/dehydratase family protein [Pantoea sp. Pent]
MESQRVLVTGGSGFIGRYLMAELKSYGATVLGTCVGNPASDDFVSVTLFDRKKLTEIIEEFQPTWIVHLAVIALVTHGNVEQIYAVNVLGTENLFNAVMDAKIQPPTMLLASTAVVYGNQSEEYLSENLPCNPTNHYSYSKMIMEMHAKSFSDKLKVHIVRPFNVIGTGQAESFLVPKIVKHFREKRELLQLGNIDSVRDYVEAKGCATMIAQLMAKQHRDPFTLNLCTGRGWSGHDVLDTLTEISGFRPRIEIVNNYVRSNEVWRLVGNPEQLHNSLGLKPHLLDLKQILTSMYNA